MEKALHIISLTVPYPVDYGGVFDLFYKLPALQQQGVKIHLHCFDYGRGRRRELERYCESVYYYERTNQFFSGLPYIVSGRKNEELFRRLLADDHPILMEGIHCTALLNDPRFSNRKKLVRLHNVESDYYNELFHAATHPLKKIYYWRESRLLAAYEKRIAGRAAFLAVTPKDLGRFKEKTGAVNVSYLPLFLPPWQVNPAEGMGGYCLYQGDLSVDANIRAVSWLAKEVFAAVDISLKIAGKNPPSSLKRLVKQYRNLTLIPDPSEDRLNELIREAHINIIPSFSYSGIKLKLLNALYNGRHCVVNEASVTGTGLEPLCHIANTTDHMRDTVEQLYFQPFRKEEAQEREALLGTMFNNTASAKKILELAGISDA
ncbi:MAG TPA: glycosyltransferase [Chitinophagaceae bacterium]